MTKLGMIYTGVASINSALIRRGSFYFLAFDSEQGLLSIVKFRQMVKTENV